MEVEGERPLKLYFIPYLAAGHMIPLCDIAQSFALRGHHVTIITTPSNAQILTESDNFRVHTLEFPSKEVGLPDGVESLSAVTDIDKSYRVFIASTLLREPIEGFVEQHPPDCIIADFLYPWIHELAKKLGIPRLVFNGFSLFTICAMESVKTNRIDVSTPFVIPDFPHCITMNSTPPEDSRGIMEPLLTVALQSDGFIINSFVELDGEEYLRHYERTTGHKAWHLGPAWLVAVEKAERGQKSVVSAQECLSWLDSKRAKSVVEEREGEESEQEKEKWLPKGFEERNKKKGMIIKGWAPQVVILGHPAIGAFVTHCGWNSTVEGVSAGVPLITWPVHSDQFYNEKLITRVRGIGVEVGADEWTLCGFYETQKLLPRDRIQAAVRKVMDTDLGHHIRLRAKEFGKTATHAVREAGSSYNNLTALIHHLKTLRA
ncbi:hypothetical protein Fmac_013570 [Flemingia macrophylla]|uniref:Glycosyltransferase n=1 Tax=Flemingia macrophylla TaxID=520843 RepID=A0ABD1MTH2_9FABA